MAFISVSLPFLARKKDAKNLATALNHRRLIVSLFVGVSACVRAAVF